jgi:hypothetical protein
LCVINALFQATLPAVLISNLHSTNPLYLNHGTGIQQAGTGKIVKGKYVPLGQSSYENWLISLLLAGFLVQINAFSRSFLRKERIETVKKRNTLP